MWPNKETNIISLSFLAFSPSELYTVWDTKGHLHKASAIEKIHGRWFLARNTAKGEELQTQVIGAHPVTILVSYLTVGLLSFQGRTSETLKRLKIRCHLHFNSRVQLARKNICTSGSYGFLSLCFNRLSFFFPFLPQNHLCQNKQQEQQHTHTIFQTYWIKVLRADVFKNRMWCMLWYTMTGNVPLISISYTKKKCEWQPLTVTTSLYPLQLSTGRPLPSRE